MDIKLDEKVISEFIGIDLEPLQGNSREIKTGINYTNEPKKNGMPPQTSDDYKLQAKQPWYQPYLTGGAGAFPYVGGGIFIAEDVVKEDNVFNTRSENEIVSDINLNLIDIKKLYQDEPLYSIIKELLQEFSNLPNEIENQKDITKIKAIVLSTIMDNIDFNDMDINIKNYLRKKIK